MKNLLFLFLLVFFNVSFADELSSESKENIFPNKITNYKACFIM